MKVSRKLLDWKSLFSIFPIKFLLSLLESFGHSGSFFKILNSWNIRTKRGFRERWIFLADMGGSDISNEILNLLWVYQKRRRSYCISFEFVGNLSNLSAGCRRPMFFGMILLRLWRNISLEKICRRHVGLKFVSELSVCENCGTDNPPTNLRPTRRRHAV